MYKAAAHSGDLGDLIYYLPVAKALGIERIYFVNRPVTKPITEKRYLFLKKLIQRHGIDFLYKEPEEPVINSWDFRKAGLPFGKNLTEIQASFAGVNVPLEPWLQAQKVKGFCDKIILHRSPRYQNPLFPIKDILEEFKKDILVIGAKEEIESVKKIVDVEECYFEDAAELCDAMYSCKCFIGNQSSPMGLAIGSGANFLQEVCIWATDCIYPRKNGFYSFDGYAECCGKSFGQPYEKKVFSTETTPPSGWEMVTKSGIKIQNNIHLYAVRDAMFAGDSREEAEEKLKQDYFKKLPHLIKRPKNALEIATLIKKHGNSQKFIEDYPEKENGFTSRTDIYKINSFI
jgi:hypothetical protein